MKKNLQIAKFPNGLTLLAESMPWLQSCAFTLLTHGGTSREPSDRLGIAGIALEMTQRGAGELDSRATVEALDFLGVERNSSVTTFHSIYSTAMLSEALEATLSIYADMVQRPRMEPSELEDAKQVALQELKAMDDDPTHRCFTELKRLRFEDPYGRSAYGDEMGIEAVNESDVQKFFSMNFTPTNAILSVAGNFDWDKLKDLVGELFGSWRPRPILAPPEICTRSSVSHIQHDSAQTHIALAYDCVPYNHPEYYRGRGLVGILSDGMSSRLFAEVREKRGLVYTISASCQTLANQGSVMCYAGTTAERAKETLDVTVETIQSLSQGISQEELTRLKTRVKTSLVTEQESSIARSSQIATDYYFLGRVPTHEEIFREIESLTEAQMLDHFDRFPASNWTMVTLGTQPLELPSGV